MIVLHRSHSDVQGSGITLSMHRNAPLVYHLLIVTSLLQHLRVTHNLLINKLCYALINILMHIYVST